MSRSVLIAYGSWAGSTREVAEFIAKTLTEEGIRVQIHEARELQDPAAFDAVIVGSAVRAGHLHPSLLKYVKRWKEALSRKPVAIFTVCLTMTEDSEENRCTVNGYLKALHAALPDFDPVSVGFFGGMVNYENFKGITRFLIRLMHIPQGDHRNWKAIASWTKSLAEGWKK